MEQFKIRASAAYEIMADGKKKGEPSVKLFDVAENYLKEKIYGYKKTFSSKYTDKGLSMEDEAIDKAIEWLDIPFVLKNTERKETEFFTGEPDLILDDYIIDIKNSWSWETFPLFDKTLKNEAYYAQMQVYMSLFEKKKAKVVYMLLTTPETYQNMPMTYEHVSKEYRMKVFDVEYNQEYIDKLISRVKYVREICKILLENIDISI